MIYVKLVMFFTSNKEVQTMTEISAQTSHGESSYLGKFHEQCSLQVYQR